jgi:serine/threonine protein kinase
MNALPEEEARRVRQHVGECEACREALPDLGQTLRPNPAAFDRDPYVDTGHLDSPDTPVPDVDGAAPEAASGPRFPFLSPPDNPEDLGRLGIYRVVGVLGEGGMGVVFDAIDMQLQRRVALKVMKPELAADLASRRRFLQEARAAAALPSDHIVPVYQVGMENDVPFLAMQYLPGESLEHRVRRPGPMPVGEAVRVGRETAAGLAAAHGGGLIHRDVKPANIWLEAGSEGEPFKRVRLLDFGLARALSGNSSLTASGMIVGTPSYLSPEQARGLQLDARSDLFSLGCVFYRMLTGTLPFRGRDTMAVLSALALNTPTPVEQLRPDVPPALARLVEQLLAKDPAARPASARAVIEQLDALGKEPPETAKVNVVPPHQRFALADAFRRPAVRWALAAGALLLVLVLAGARLGRKPGQRHPAQAPTAAGPAPAGEPIKLGVLFPLTGTLEASGSSVTEATLRRRACREVDRGGAGERGRRLLVVRRPEDGPAGLREVRPPAALPGAVRGAGGVAQHRLPRGRPEPADPAGGAVRRRHPPQAAALPGRLGLRLPAHGQPDHPRGAARRAGGPGRRRKIPAAGKQ